MSTIDRVSARVRRGTTRVTLTPRTVRMRNVLLRRAAAHLGLAVPAAADLRELPDHMNLPQAVAWWHARQTGSADKDAKHAVAARPHLVLRIVFSTAIALLSLVFSYGPAQ